jgi:hypothetical protein
MRLTSDFFVAALVRRAFTEGAFAAVTKRGAAEAGAIFLIVDRLDGSADLYGPAPQSFMEEGSTERRFERVLTGAERLAIRERLDKERRFDSDLWIVEIEDRAGRSFLPD